MSNIFDTNKPLPDFSKVYEAWDQAPTRTPGGWTYVPAVGTFGRGPSSHFTYGPGGQLDHYSAYDGFKRIERSKF